MKKFFLNALFTLLTLSSLSAQSSPKNSPVNTFEFFWQLFDQNYASFSEKDINWQAVYDEYRPKISEQTSDLELFQVLSDMLRPLHDDHVNLIARDLDTAFNASRPSRILESLRPLPGKERRPLFNAAIEKTLVENGFKPLQELGPEFRGRKLFTYTDNGKIGYLRFTRSFTTRRFFNFVSLNGLLEKIFSSFTHLEDGLIIDTRFNIGGDDSFSKKIAGRFVTEKKLTYYKQTRKNGAFGELQAHYLPSKGRHKFPQAVVLLTNDKTVSAADVFALMMSQLPQVSIVGERSNGSYSDLLAKKLPNDWTITLSNQRYLSLDKLNYEGKGTPVDIEVKNKLEDLKQGKDTVLKKALEVLNHFKS